MDNALAAANVAAFLKVIRGAEGTAGPAGYHACFGYRHWIMSFADHPVVTGEWRGERLSDAMCRAAGFSPGCVSTAAGAYQIIKPTWIRMRDALDLPDFSPASQDAAAIELIRRRDAIEDVKAGRFEVAIGKCSDEWASLPGGKAQQPQRDIETLRRWFVEAGGTLSEDLRRTS